MRLRKIDIIQFVNNRLFGDCSWRFVNEFIVVGIAINLKEIGDTYSIVGNCISIEPHVGDACVACIAGKLRWRESSRERNRWYLWRITEFDEDSHFVDGSVSTGAFQSYGDIAKFLTLPSTVAKLLENVLVTLAGDGNGEFAR